METWEGDAAMRGQEGKVSSPLRGRHPSVAPYALCPFACVLMSGTLAFLRHHDNLLWLKNKTVAARSAVALSAPVVGNATQQRNGTKLMQNAAKLHQIAPERSETAPN